MRRRSILVGILLLGCGSNVPVSSTTTSHKRPDYAPPGGDAEVENVSGAAAVPRADDAMERIAFIKAGAVWLMRPDGGDPRRVTGRQSGSLDEAPQISPFGDQVAFASNRDKVWKIYVSALDGSKTRAVTDGSDGGDRQPSWSPDGSRLLFVRGRDGEKKDVMVVVAAGAHLQKPERLVPGADAESTYVGWPTYTPDGKRVVFSADRSEGLGTTLWIVEIDGSGLRRLTRHARPLRWLRDVRPHVSPDGTRVAFASNRHAAGESDAGDLDVYTVELASGRVKRLTQDAGVADDPSYSPDGKRLYFTSTREASRPTAVEIYAMAAQGGVQERLTRDEFPENSAPAAGRVP